MAVEYYVYHIFKEGDALIDGYIGITKSPDHRKHTHFRKLLKQNHINYKLQNAYNTGLEYNFKILIKSDLDYCRMIENILRPSANIGLNIYAGGNKPRTRYKKVKYISEITAEERKEKLLNKINGSHPWLKHNRCELSGNEFTSETASILAKQRALSGTLPGQIKSKDGTHHWFKDEHAKNVAERNKLYFTNTVTVTDKFGNTKRINSEEFKLQNIGNIEDRIYVGVSSKEAKRRRLNKGII